MIISRTPYRVSLFGGGTDYPAFYNHAAHGGAVIGFALDRYCYLSVRNLPPYFPHKHRIVYSQVETVQSVDDIDHPAVKAVLRHCHHQTGIEIHHDGDVPAMSGLGSSSAFVVGLIHAMWAMSGRRIGTMELAKLAIIIEQLKMKEAVGDQDQVFAAYGGFNRIDFMQHGFRVTPVITDPWRVQYLLDHLMMFYTGHQRRASDIAKGVIACVPINLQHLNRLRGMVDEADAIIHGKMGQLIDLGEMLWESWQLKRELSPSVSTPGIDDMFDDARRAGAIGGKLLGAGGGGFALMFAPPDRHDAIRRELSYLTYLKPGIDHQGSQIVLYQPNGLAA